MRLDRPRSWPLLAALIGLVVLAGCAQVVDDVRKATGQEPGDGLGLTAMEAHEVAQEQAEAWHPDAELTLASTMETDATDMIERLMAEVPGEAPDVDPDPRIGDGRAPQWMLEYTTPDRDSAIRLFVTAEGETVIFDETSEVDGDRSIDDRWQVDSDEAVKTALQEPAVQRYIEERRGPVMLSLVFVDEPGHNWQMHFLGEPRTSPTGPDHAPGAIHVNATTGERVPGSIRQVEPEPFAHTGNVSAQDPTATFPIDVAGDDAVLEAHLRWDAGDGNTTPSLNLSLVDPDGQVVTPDDRSRSEDHAGLVAGRIEAGDYTLRVRLVDGAPDGSPVGFELEGEVAVPTGR